MTISEILQQLERLGPQPPIAALQAAIEQKEQIVSELIAALNHVTDHAADFLDDTQYTLYIHALYLLAQFREPRALEPFMRFFSLPGDLAPELTGDLLAENGAQLMASVCGGDPGPLLKLAQDDSVHPHVRSQAIAGLVVQPAWGERTREQAATSVRQLFSGGLAKPGNAAVWAEAVSAACYLNAVSLLPEVGQVYEEGLVDESILPRDHAENLLREPKPQLFAGFLERHPPITDTAAMVSRWVCFAQPPEGSPSEQAELDALFGLNPAAGPTSSGPIPLADLAKVGRNDPCPCGSGKKYKKCCGK